MVAIPLDSPLKAVERGDLCCFLDFVRSMKSSDFDKAIVKCTSGLKTSSFRFLYSACRQLIEQDTDTAFLLLILRAMHAVHTGKYMGTKSYIDVHGMKNRVLPGVFDSLPSRGLDKRQSLEAARLEEVPLEGWLLWKDVWRVEITPESFIRRLENNFVDSSRDACDTVIVSGFFNEPRGVFTEYVPMFLNNITNKNLERLMEYSGLAYRVAIVDWLSQLRSKTSIAGQLCLKYELDIDRFPEMKANAARNAVVYLFNMKQQGKLCTGNIVDMVEGDLVKVEEASRNFLAIGDIGAAAYCYLTLSPKDRASFLMEQRALFERCESQSLKDLQRRNKFDRLPLVGRCRETNEFIPSKRDAFTLEDFGHTPKDIEVVNDEVALHRVTQKIRMHEWRIYVDGEWTNLEALSRIKIAILQIYAPQLRRIFFIDMFTIGRAADVVVADLLSDARLWKIGHAFEQYDWPALRHRAKDLYQHLNSIVDTSGIYFWPGVPNTVKQRIQDLVLSVDGVNDNSARNMLGNVRLGNIASAVLQRKSLSKDEQIANWHRRPLRVSQSIYAALDVVVLHAIADKLERQTGLSVQILSGIRDFTAERSPSGVVSYLSGSDIEYESDGERKVNREMRVWCSALCRAIQSVRRGMPMMGRAMLIALAVLAVLFAIPPVEE